MNGKVVGVDRIVGGKEVTIEQFPWQVSLINERGHFCGGIIIDRRRILTAAHCINKEFIPDYELFVYVRAGSTSRVGGGVIRAVEKVIVHEDYAKPVDFNNDIALIYLKYPVVYSKSIQPISLPQPKQQLPANTTLIVSGWGYRMEEGEHGLPEKLHAVTVHVVDQKQCAVSYEESLTDKMLCAGMWNVGGKDSCQV